MPAIDSGTGSNATEADVVDLKDFTQAKKTITKLVGVMDEQEQVLKNNRMLRYTEIDIEAERRAGRLAPDELFIPQHVIDSNIRREQPVYITYLTMSPRCCVLKNLTDGTQDSANIEADFTNKCYYEGWQMPMFRMVDGMEQNGYGIVEIVFDTSKPGHVAVQDVCYGNFGFSLDSKEIQGCEMLTRRYDYTKTQLEELVKTAEFSQEEVDHVVASQDATDDYKNISLYKVEKVMFRDKGVVHVAWSCERKCNDWLRGPKPLHIGRMAKSVDKGWVPVFETAYPYVIAPYNISENTTIRNYRGRCYLDQDFQEGITSLMSSYVTAHRRASMLIFSKDSENDPNSDVLTQSNINFEHAAVINSKVKQFQLIPPPAEMLSAIQALGTANSQETSQINYAAQNRQDSRKTATEIQASQQTSQQLSSIQLALFSATMKSIRSIMFEIVQGRISANLLEPTLASINPALYKAYIAYVYSVKPAGDTDVVERQQRIQQMQQSWPVMQATPAAQPFLMDLIELLFPDKAEQYLATFPVADAKTKALTACAAVIGSLVKDPNALSPQEKGNLPQLQQLLQQVTQLLQPQGQQGGQQQQQPVKQGQ